MWLSVKISQQLVIVTAVDYLLFVSQWPLLGTSNRLGGGGGALMPTTPAMVPITLK